LSVATRAAPVVVSISRGYEMPAFVLLMNITAKGAADMKGLPQRIEESVRRFEGLGGKVLSFHVTMGPYDMVAVGEAPSDEVAAAMAMALAAGGNVTTTSMRAFSREELAAILAKLS
jgi:uncharacterized protein with GYD domain